MNFISDITDIPRNTSISIYGAGKQGLILASLLRARGDDTRVISFIDDKPSDKLVCGIKVTPLPQLSPAPDCVLVPSGPASESMAERVEARGLKCLRIHPMMDVYHMCFPSEQESCRADAEKVLPLFSVPEDREVFSRLVENRMFKPRDGDSRDRLRQYPPGGRQYMDYINHDDIRFAIDGGVEDGCETWNFISSWKNLVSMDAFDPCVEDYEKSPFKNRIEASGKCRVSHACLGSRSGRAFFSSSCKMIFEEPSDCLGDCRPTDVISLDDFMEKSPHGLDIVKLDVEGFELNVLKGAVRTIKRHRPHLVLSIYHSRHDITGIPLWVAENFPDYKFRIGHYSNSFSETVLYCSSALKDAGVPG